MAAEFVFEDSSSQQMLAKIMANLKSVTNGDSKFQGLLGTIVYRDIMSHFQSEQGEDGAWPDWSPSYAKYMERIGRNGNKKLQFTGRLRQSMLPTNVKKVSEGYLWFDNAKTKTGFPYAQAHDEGGPKLPQREFMWLSQKGAEQICQQMLAFILDEGI